MGRMSERHAELAEMAEPDQELLVRVFTHKGHLVHEKAFPDRLGFLPASYFICPADAVAEIGTGRTPDEAVADKLAKRTKEAA